MKLALRVAGRVGGGTDAAAPIVAGLFATADPL
jgi:hypothetical protein